MDRSASAALTILAAAGFGPAAGAGTLVALTGDNRLVWIDIEKRTASAPKPIAGSPSRVVGIDVRPANGKLYGVTAEGEILVLAPDTGAVTAISRLSERVELGANPIVDFNPVADRLRVITVYGTSLRINVDTGQTIVDKPVAYDQADPNAAHRPALAAGAYVNALAGAKATDLFHVDARLGVLVLQNPPNEGVLKTRGRLGVAIRSPAAMDIATDTKGVNTALLLSGRTLHAVDLDSGRATPIGPIAGLGVEVTDIAALPR